MISKGRNNIIRPLHVGFVDISDRKLFTLGQTKSIIVLSLDVVHPEGRENVLVELMVKRPGEVTVNTYVEGKRVGSSPVIEGFEKPQLVDRNE